MVPWHKLPVFLGLTYLEVRRHLHQQYNLLNVGQTPTGIRFDPANYPYRTADGKFNDPFNEGVGSQNSFFGRNCPPVDQKSKVIIFYLHIYVYESVEYDLTTNIREYLIEKFLNLNTFSHF